MEDIIFGMIQLAVGIFIFFNPYFLSPLWKLLKKSSSNKLNLFVRIIGVFLILVGLLSLFLALEL